MSPSILEAKLRAKKQVGLTGYLFNWNATNGVIAVCRKEEYWEAREIYNTKVATGVIPATEKVMILVPRIVTFAENEFCRRAIHTEVMGAKMKFLTTKLVERLTGEKNSKSFLDEETLDEFGGIIYRRDPRIYVPFAGDSYTHLWQQFDRYSPEEALSILLEGVVGYSRI